jgi:arylsulfatase
MGWELMGRKAYRFGDYKIVGTRPPPYGTGEWELYNVKADSVEKNDLATLDPKLLKEMITRWKKYAKKNGVVLPDEMGAY